MMLYQNFLNNFHAYRAGGQKLTRGYLKCIKMIYTLSSYLQIK